MNACTSRSAGWPLVGLVILTLLASSAARSGPITAAPAADSHTFPETSHTVSGAFWTYWQGHGGLAQQGYPISEELQEVSDLNGQTYTVQYFERAVFEKHPENQPPYDVLLSQLGTFRYKAKYGDVGAPGQQPSTANARFFSETKHTLGGKFRAYWEAHGALAQQGYPISDEFTEVSDLNNKPYTVQYFERAVFELHPENAGTPYEVLLSQLGKFRLQQKNNVPPTVGAQPTATPEAAPVNAEKGPLYKVPEYPWYGGTRVGLTGSQDEQMGFMRGQYPDGTPGAEAAKDFIDQWKKATAHQGAPDNTVYLPVKVGETVVHSANYSLVKATDAPQPVDYSKGIYIGYDDPTNPVPVNRQIHWGTPSSWQSVDIDSQTRQLRFIYSDDFKSQTIPNLGGAGSRSQELCDLFQALADIRSANSNPNFLYDTSQKLKNNDPDLTVDKSKFYKGDANSRYIEENNMLNFPSKTP